MKHGSEALSPGEGGLSQPPTLFPSCCCAAQPSAVLVIPGEKCLKLLCLPFLYVPDVTAEANRPWACVSEEASWMPPSKAWPPVSSQGNI